MWKMSIEDKITYFDYLNKLMKERIKQIKWWLPFGCSLLDDNLDERIRMSQPPIEKSIYNFYFLTDWSLLFFKYTKEK